MPQVLWENSSRGFAVLQSIHCPHAQRWHLPYSASQSSECLYLNTKNAHGIYPVFATLHQIDILASANIKEDYPHFSTTSVIFTLCCGALAQQFLAVPYSISSASQVLFKVLGPVKALLALMASPLYDLLLREQLTRTLSNNVVTFNIQMLQQFGWILNH